MKNTMKLSMNNLQEAPIIAKKIVDMFAKKNQLKPTIWLFDGELGAGKTTLIKFICEEFGVLDNVNSPTFNLMNYYEDRNNKPIYHFDLYRLNNSKKGYLNEIEDIGIREYLYSDDYCFIEWPFNYFDKSSLKLVNNDDLDRYSQIALLINITLKNMESRDIRCDIVSF